MLRAIAAVADTPMLLMALAEAHRGLGDPVEGLNYLAEVAQVIEATDMRRDEAELYRKRPFVPTWLPAG
jgi:hypothetical protein